MPTPKNLNFYPVFKDPGMISFLCGHALEKLREIPADSIHLCLTSPPYFGHRDYGTGTWEGGDEDCPHEISRWEGPKQNQGAQNGHAAQKDKLHRNICSHCGARRIDQQIGAESSLEEYVTRLVEIFQEVKRVLHPTGVVALNLGDSYASSAGPQVDGTKQVPGSQKGAGGGTSRQPPAGLKPKDLCMIPARVALALQADGWYLRSDIIWVKKNPLPGSYTDRPVSSNEHWFLLSKNPVYFWDGEAIKQPSAGKLPWGGRPAGKINDPAAQGAHGSTSLHRAMSKEEKMKWYEGGRNFRESDSFFTSLDLEIAQTQEYLDHLQEVKANNGLWINQDEEPLATICPAKGFPGAHFATFNQTLIEPFIAAGTSEQGVCPTCLTPWNRVLHKDVSFHSGSGKTGHEPVGKHEHSEQATSGPYDVRKGPVVTSSTLGWRPGCSCYGVQLIDDPPRRPLRRKETEEEFAASLATYQQNFNLWLELWGLLKLEYARLPHIHATVLDPFGGAGTTGLVCHRRGRDCFLIDLNPEYLQMAQERIYGL